MRAKLYAQSEQTLKSQEDMRQVRQLSAAPYWLHLVAETLEKKKVLVIALLFHDLGPYTQSMSV